MFDVFTVKSMDCLIWNLFMCALTLLVQPALLPMRAHSRCDRNRESAFRRHLYHLELL